MQTNYWPLSLPIVVDGTVWQVTLLRLLSSCFVPRRSPIVSSANTELRLWYGEDLRGFTEGDNGGKTCADVYGLLAETVLRNKPRTLNE